MHAPVYYRLGSYLAQYSPSLSVRTNSLSNGWSYGVEVLGNEFATIEFVGEQTIRTVAEAHRRLTEALVSSGAVEASIKAQTSVDLSFVQLIESARRTAREAGASFRLAEPATGPLRETLERGGFLAAPADREFWLMQTEDR
jgi:hypothetical protein